MAPSAIVESHSMGAILLLLAACSSLDLAMSSGLSETCERAADAFCSLCARTCGPHSEQPSVWLAEKSRVSPSLDSWQCINQVTSGQGKNEPRVKLIPLVREEPSESRLQQNRFADQLVDLRRDSNRDNLFENERNGASYAGEWDSCSCWNHESQLRQLVHHCHVSESSNATDVFVEHENNIDTFRIPAIVQTLKKTLLAFAEARVKSSSDCGHKAIVLKRSTDLGKTWLPMQVIYGMQDPHIVVGNPMPVVDQQTGNVFLQFVTNNDTSGCDPGSKNWQVVSKNDGLTWSSPVDLSGVLGPYAGVLPGPGAALQLSKVKPGRLVFAGHYGAYLEDIVWYSDDHGETYHRVNTTFPKMDEVTLTQLQNGSILFNMRNAHLSPCKCRAVARSDDGGETWSKVRFDATLISPVCQAALAQIGSSLYFSNPASTSRRENLTIRVSHDGGTTWSNKTHLVASGSTWGGYSSLVPTELGANAKSALGGILYERYTVSGKEAISFSTFPLNFDVKS